MVRGLLVCLTLVSLASAQQPTAATLQDRGCELGTATYRNGDDNTESCLVMQCNNGHWEYTGEISHECGNCTVQGDPHFWTFDDTLFLEYGRKYKFGGVGNFAVTQPGFEMSPSFGVNASFHSCNSAGGANYTCIQNITYSEPGIKVELVLPIQLKIHKPTANITVIVNDRVQKSTIGVKSASAFFGTDGTVLVFNHNDIEEPANFFCISVVGSQGLSVSLCQHTLNFAWLYVFPMPILRNAPISQLYGLCNTYTGTNQDNLYYRNGTKGGDKYDITKFADSWRAQK